MIPVLGSGLIINSVEVWHLLNELKSLIMNVQNHTLQQCVYVQPVETRYNINQI